ncbi:MAG: hypothetical protein M3S32_03680 [Acidobacteriota bacterium]|nr:hypothetical protein [Acidobacteriota bacterium]
MNDCVRPLDPLDTEALAAGEEGILAGDASAHASVCGPCATAVEEARTLLRRLEAVSGSGEVAPPSGATDLADRVVRIRPFSARERRSLRLWAPPAGGGLLVFTAGFALLAAPGLTAGDQAALGLSALAPLAGLARATFRSLSDALSTAPAAWEALSSAARLEAPLGALALLLLAPAAFGFRRVLARAARRG